MRRRLDAELVRRGLAANPDEARAAIDSGRVTRAGRPASKAGTLVDTREPLAVSDRGPAFVSRGGEKLAAALDRFEVDVVGKICLDAGASTGGFTDCLLQRGAARVAAVDVGYGQLDWALRSDERVTVLERTNVRFLESGDLPGTPELIVADLSFVSLRTAVPALAGLLGERGSLLLLVKPQFEAPPDLVGEGGVVSDPAVWASCIERVADACVAAGTYPQGVMASPLTGPAGNVEFFLISGTGRSEGMDVSSAVAEGESLIAGSG